MKIKCTQWSSTIQPIQTKQTSISHLTVPPAGTVAVHFILSPPFVIQWVGGIIFLVKHIAPKFYIATNDDSYQVIAGKSCSKFFFNLQGACQYIYKRHQCLSFLSARCVFVSLHATNNTFCEGTATHSREPMSYLYTNMFLWELNCMEDGLDRMVFGFTTICEISANTTKVVSSNPVHDEVYSIQHCVIKCQ